MKEVIYEIRLHGEIGIYVPDRSQPIVVKLDLDNFYLDQDNEHSNQTLHLYYEMIYHLQTKIKDLQYKKIYEIGLNICSNIFHVTFQKPE